MLSRLQAEASAWALTAHVVIHRTRMERNPATKTDTVVQSLVYGGPGAIQRQRDNSNHQLLLPIDSPALASGDVVTVDGETYTVPEDMPPTATRAAVRKIPVSRRGGQPYDHR